MDVNGLSTLIANLGFPIACVIAMFWMWNKEREEHRKETDQLREAVVNNTRAMENLLEVVKSRGSNT